MNASELLAHKETLRREFEKDMAAIDRIIGQLNRANGAGGAEAVPINGKPTNAPRGQEKAWSQSTRGPGPGRPAGEMMAAIRNVARKCPVPFSINEIWDGLNVSYEGHQFTRKGVSSALGRLAEQGELKVHKPGVIGQHGNYYVLTDKFEAVR